MWLPAPRSSPAPHFEGQRALSGGGIQLGVWATADAVANNAATTMIDPVMCPLHFMASSRGRAPAGAGAAPRMRDRNGAFKRRLRAAGGGATTANVTKKVRHCYGYPGRIEHKFAILHNSDCYGPFRLPAIMQDMLPSKINDEVMRKVRNAEVIGKLYRLVEITGRGAIIESGVPGSPQLTRASGM